MDGSKQERLRRERLPTGVPGLDHILNGGIPRGSVLLVAGQAGSGKTTFGNQLAYHHAGTGEVAVIATLTAETHDHMISHLAAFGFFNPDLVGDRVQYLSVQTALDDGHGVDALPDALRRITRDTKSTLLVVDGTAVVEDLAVNRLDFLNLTNRLQAQSALLGCTLVLLISRNPDDLGDVAMHADGLIELRQELIGARRVRTLQVVKLRGVDHLGGRHEFAIETSGIVVAPRLKAAFARARPFSEPDGERLGFGVPELDRMLAGGFLPGSSTLLIGTPGAGKTLTALQFVIAGAQRGEHGLIAGFHERPERLIRAAAAIGLDLATPVERGLVRIMWRPPLEISPDAWAWELLTAVQEFQPRRLVVDALTDLERRITGANRVGDFVAALTGALRAAGVTTIFNAELSILVGPELRVPLPVISVALDNLVLLRYFEIESRLHRLISVLKMRESAFDPVIREFEISNAGIVIGDPFVRARSLLTGASTSESALVFEP